MAKQTIALGTAPTGVGGDTPRSAFTKAQQNFDELYAADAISYKRTNILGAVAQSGGVPTGAIIERGGTVAGFYVKYADGTLIQWGYAAPIAIAITGLNTGDTGAGGVYLGGYNKTFPMPFSTLPTCNGQYVVSGRVIWVAQNGDSTYSAVSFFCTSPNAFTAQGTFYWSAIGRWF